MVDQNEDDDILTYTSWTSACRAVADNYSLCRCQPMRTSGNSVVPDDVSFFAIDPATGQIMVKSALAQLPRSSDEESEDVVRGRRLIHARAVVYGPQIRLARPQMMRTATTSVVTINVYGRQ